MGWQNNINFLSFSLRKWIFFFGTFGSLLPFYRFLKGFRRQDDKPDKYPIQHSIYRFLKTFLIRKEMNRKQDSS